MSFSATNLNLISAIKNWELASYIVTVVGLPLTIVVFLFEQRKERENQDEEAYQLLSETYTDFLKRVRVRVFHQIRAMPYKDIEQAHHRTGFVPARTMA